MSTTPVTPLSEEQKIMQTVIIASGAAQQIAAVWGHETISSLIGEVPALAPVVVGFLDAILAATKKKA